MSGEHDVLPPWMAGIAGPLPRRHEGHEGTRSPAAAPTTNVGGVASCPSGPSCPSCPSCQAQSTISISGTGLTW